MLSRYLDPKNDFAFKKIFGEEHHKRIPIDFLNAVFNLKGKDRIIDLKFLHPKQPPQIEARKESIVDVLVEDQRGSKYIVEMQVAKVEGFEERAQYYAAKTYCSHFGRGGKYQDLKRVIFLAITDYVVFPDKKRYKSDHITLDTESNENDLKAFSFTFVELPKFTKKLEELQTLEEKWYYFLKHADEDHNIYETLSKHPEIHEAYEVLDRFHWTENELQWYEKLTMDSLDAQGMIDAAHTDGLKEGKELGRKEGAEKGLEKGLKEGEEKGLEKGKELGLREGEEKGLEKGKKVAAINMLKEGFSVEQAAKISGLSEESIVCVQKALEVKR